MVSFRSLCVRSGAVCVLYSVPDEVGHTEHYDDAEDNQASLGAGLYVTRLGEVYFTEPCSVRKVDVFGNLSTVGCEAFIPFILEIRQCEISDVLSH